MVGTGRFELPTPRTPSECSTRLSHVPTIKGLRWKFHRLNHRGEYAALASHLRRKVAENELILFGEKLAFPLKHMRCWDRTCVRQVLYACKGKLQFAITPKRTRAAVS